MPSDLARITADNADQLRLVAELGAINVLRAWFSPNASKLAAILVNQNFRVSGIGVWDLGSGEQSFALEAKPADITFSPDGQSVALIFWDQVIEVYDSTLGELLWSLESDFDEAAFASDWEQIAVSSWDGGGGTQTSTVRVLDPVSGTERWSAEVKDQIGGLSFSPDGRTLYGQVSHGPGVDGSLACWAVDDGQTCAVPPLKGLPIFSSDGRFAAGPSDWLVSPGIEVYETGAWKRVATMDAGGKPVHHLALSADGEIVGAEVGYRLRLWDAGSGRELVELPDQFIDFQFSPDGRLVAAWDSLGSLKLLGVSP